MRNQPICNKSEFSYRAPKKEWIYKLFLYYKGEYAINLEFHILAYWRSNNHRYTLKIGTWTVNDIIFLWLKFQINRLVNSEVISTYTTDYLRNN